MNVNPRVALVGCGWFARVAHIPALCRMEKEGRIEVVALCSRSDASLARASAEFGRPMIKKYTELQSLLNDKDIDVVVLLLPISTMPEAIRATLGAGKHLISEKPCSPSVAACIELLAFHSKLAKPPLWAVAENWRFKKSVRIIEKILKSGEIGSIQSADFRMALYISPDRDQGWRQSPKHQGGHILDSGVHFISLLRKVIDEVNSVSAIVSQHRSHLTPADSVTAVLGFANGASGSFHLSFAAPECNITPSEFRVTGSQGVLHAYFHTGSIEICNYAGKRIISVNDDPWEEGGVYELLVNFIDSLNSGNPLQSSPWEALRDVAVLESMLESSRTRQTIFPASFYPFLTGAPHEVSTYARVWNFRPSHFVACSSISDVRSAIAESVAANMRIRALGNYNSWASHIVTDDVCLQISGLNQILAIDKKRKTVRVSAGVRLGDLTRALGLHDLSLPSLPFISDITVGGAISTGTHGTSLKRGILSDFVHSITLVLASGEIKKIGPESPPEELCAARVGVGMLGVVVEVEFQAVDMPWVRPLDLKMDLKTFLNRHLSIVDQNEHVWAKWCLGEESVRVQCLEAHEHSEKGSHRYVVNDNACWLSPPTASAFDRLSSRAKEIKRQVRSICKTPKNIGLEAPPETTQKTWMSMQYGFPISQLCTVVKSICASDFVKLHPDRIVELKFLKGNNLSYLGPNADGDAVLFNLWWEVDDTVKYTIFNSFETLMRGHGGRPHWGKFHKPPDINYMQSVYPQWSKFESVRVKFDPKGTFSIF